jgi:superfamily I DNA/RNA helicase
VATMIPSSVRFTRSPAEVRLFAGLRDALGDGYTVLHHVRWLQKERRVEDGEADFLVLHRERGALVAEVKGGRIAYDASSGGWTSTDSSGEEHEIRDPVDQAKDAAYSLARYLRSLPEWPRGWGPIGYAVCFPDGELKGSPPDYLGPVLIDERDVRERLGERVEEILEYWREERHHAGPRGVEVAVRALARDVEIRHPLASDLDEADREIIRLSETQFRVLDMLGANRRVSVSGPAGSGKTLLAAEKARRLAAEGLRVLFTCYNRPLADHLREALADAEGIDVSGFHQLCTAITREAGIEVRGDRGEDRFWRQTLPAAFERAVQIVGARYDALIVDEGQDFEPEWWLALLMLLEDPGGGIFHVFSDDNQAIYRKPGGLVDGMFEVRLFEDWRNTSQIFETVKAFYEGDEVLCKGPDGPNVELVSVTKDAIGNELSRVLHRIVIDGDVPASDVAVLTPHRAEHSPVLGRLGAFTLTAEPSGKQDVRLDSIHRFKGLDAKAVVLCDIDRFVEEQFRRLMYVGCSRARTYLAVLITEGDAA